MKKHLLFLFTLSLFLFNCSIIDKLTMFNIDIQTTTSIAPTTLIATPFDIMTPDIQTNSESSFANNNTRKDLIESIVLKQIKMTITSPDDGNFNFLKEMRIFIQAEGLEEVEMANIFDLEDNNSKVIILNSTGQELREYLKKDSYDLRIETTTDETINERHNITIDSEFRVDAKILGV